jgi:hypothetical protein
MTEKIDWKQELLDSANFNGKQEKILKNGPKSLTDSWILGALYTRWKKLKGIIGNYYCNQAQVFL